MSVSKENARSPRRNVREWPRAEAAVDEIEPPLCRSGIDGHLVVDELKNASFLERWFSDESKAMGAEARACFDHPERLFFTAKVGVDAERLPELGRLLREMISSWIEENTSLDTDRVATLTLGLY